MTHEEKIIDMALLLLEPFEANEHNKTDNVHWVEDDDGNSDWGDYCGDCIDTAVKDARIDYLKSQRKKPLKLRDKQFRKFGKCYNYGGGYEDDSFNFCNNCGKRLDVSVLPNDNNLDECIEQLNNGSKIDDSLGYECYWLLYNNWGKDAKGYKKNM